MTTRINRTRSSRRRGSTYILFVGTAMIVTVIGLSALMAMRIQLRAAEGTNDSVAARSYAQSAVELGFLMINENDSWRADLGSGSWVIDRPIGPGTLSLEATILDDGDGNAANDPVVLTGTGVSGSAQHKMEVTVVPDNGGMSISPGSWRQVVN